MAESRANTQNDDGLGCCGCLVVIVLLSLGPGLLGVIFGWDLSGDETATGPPSRSERYVSEIHGLYDWYTAQPGNSEEGCSDGPDWCSLPGNRDLIKQGHEICTALRNGVPFGNDGTPGGSHYVVVYPPPVSLGAPDHFAMGLPFEIEQTAAAYAVQILCPEFTSQITQLAAGQIAPSGRYWLN